MPTADGQRLAGIPEYRHRLSIILLTALGLLIAAFAIGVNSGGTRAGAIEALAVVATTTVFARAAWKRTLPSPFLASPAMLAMIALAAISALSVGWSLLPGASTVDALRLVAYCCVLALAALLAQSHQDRSREFALGLLIAAAGIAIYALSSRCLPGLFPADDDFARLRLPFGYWNAVGTVAALGFLLALWAGSRRDATKLTEVASYPLGGLLFACLMLSQSRAALLATLFGVALWLLVVPRRLRSAGWLGSVLVLGGLLVAWAYSQTALTTDHIPLADRKDVGVKLLVGLLLMCAALGAAGFAIRRRRLSVALKAVDRQKLGKQLLIALGASFVVLLLAVAVATDRGLATISDGVGDVFSTGQATTANSPSRLTQTSSLRGRYWSETYEIFKAHTLHGTGADTFGVARLPYRPDTLMAAHAHGMVPQVAADLGALGLIALLALMVIWLIAALRLTGARRAAPWKWLDGADEVRLASVAMLVAAFVFGVHSSLDWIWFLPGVAFFGIFAGGWVVGTPAAHRARAGQAASPSAAPSAADNRWRIVQVAAILVGGLLVAHGVYQPVRAAKKVDEGLTLVSSNPAKAEQLGLDALELDPASARAYMLVASAQNNADHPKQAEQTLVLLTTRQPGNPEAWLRLATFRLVNQEDPDGAIEALRPVFYISSFDSRAQGLLTAARQAKANKELERIAEKKRKKLERQLDKLEAIQRQLGVQPSS